MRNKFKSPKEWLKQAEYDYKTASAMFKAGRYIYAVFMCHLAIEKVLEGIYAKRFKKDPPRIHNLNYFCERIKMDFDSEDLKCIDRLNSLSVLTRYPDDLQRLVFID